MDLLIKINQESGVTVIVITHDPDVARQCSRIVEIHDGKIME